jgi:hypothetical protein
MLMRPEPPKRAGAKDVLAVALLVGALAIAMLASVSVQAQSASSLPGSITSVVDDGLPGKGLPPSPGPTNPDGAD